MYVLIDIEWVQKGASSIFITQIAASRVTETWESTAQFSCLVRPDDALNCNWGHLAFNGYSPTEFKNGVSEAECFERLAAFLEDDDSLYVWSNDSKKILCMKYSFFLGSPLPRECRYVDELVYAAAKERRINKRGLYQIAKVLGIVTPVPKHRSINDIFVLAAVLSSLKNINLECWDEPQVTHTPPQKKIISKEKRNASILERVNYNFVFTPDSPVFHRTSCKIMLRANEIRGSVYYDTAAKNRRPCKLCHPELVDNDAIFKANTSQFVTEIVDTTLLGNQQVHISKHKLVGCCHNKIHPGDLTLKIMKEHKCLIKKCRHFEKYENSPYWFNQERQRIKKAEKKARKSPPPKR